MTNTKSVVALSKGQNIAQNVARIFDLLGGVTKMIEKGSTVVIKPNAGHATPSESAVCTNPEVLAR